MPIICFEIVITTASMEILSTTSQIHDFFIMNNGNATHVSGPNFTKFCIDLTIISPFLVLNSEWYVEVDNWRSDHYRITINLDVMAEYIPKVKHKYNTNKINWSKFNKFWESSGDNYNFVDFLNSHVCIRYSFLLNPIIEAVENSLPVKKKDSKQQN